MVVVVRGGTGGAWLCEAYKRGVNFDTFLMSVVSTGSPVFFLLGVLRSLSIRMILVGSLRQMGGGA